MNARTFRLYVIAVMAINGIAGLALLALVSTGTDAGSRYATLKDAIPLVIAMSAAWIGYCIQRRQAYLKEVRELYSVMIVPVQDAIQYTYSTFPLSREEFGKTLKGLSVAIEETRGVFSNIGEDQGNKGLFPFEKLKHIHATVSKLGYDGHVTPDAAKLARDSIVADWKALRKHYLCELERGNPAKADSPFLQ